LARYTQLVYGLQALAVLLGLWPTGPVVSRFAFWVPAVTAIGLNYARRTSTRGTLHESHFRWQIRTFWFACLWLAVTAIISAPLYFVLIGMVTARVGTLAIGAWVIYRVARGWQAARTGRAMPQSPGDPS
jgi:uncharacterized membrane protein